MSGKKLLILFARTISTILGILCCFASGTWLMAAWNQTQSLTTLPALIGWVTLAIGAFLIWLGLWPRKTSASLHSVKRILTYQDEVNLAKALRVVRVVYQDDSGEVTKVELELYRPRDDVYAYAYCRGAKEPQTFLIERILDWKELPKRFTHNPLIEEWFDTFGPSPSESSPRWQDWLQQKRQFRRAKPSGGKRPSVSE